MPFIAVDPIYNRPRIPIGVEDDEAVQCPVCDESLHVRDGPSVARHFYRATEDKSWTTISRDTWKTAWLNLQETRELRPRQFFDITSVRRGSIAVPFLQEALELPADPDERVVYPPEDDLVRP